MVGRPRWTCVHGCLGGLDAQRKARRGEPAGTRARGWGKLAAVPPCPIKVQFEAKQDNQSQPLKATNAQGAQRRIKQEGKANKLGSGKETRAETSASQYYQKKGGRQAAACIPCRLGGARRASGGGSRQRHRPRGRRLACRCLALVALEAGAQQIQLLAIPRHFLPPVARLRGRQGSRRGSSATGILSDGVRVRATILASHESNGWRGRVVRVPTPTPRPHLARGVALPQDHQGKLGDGAVP